MDPHGTEFVFSPAYDPQVDKIRAHRKCLKPSSFRVRQMRQKKQDCWEEKPLNRATYEEGAELSPWATGDEVWRTGMDISDAYRCWRPEMRMTLRFK